MAILLFNSVFSEELFSYLSEREKSGYKNHSALLSNLRKFDRFCALESWQMRLEEFLRV